LEIRSIKKRPKLTELLKMFRDNEDPVKKEEFINKIKRLYQAEKDLVRKNF